MLLGGKAGLFLALYLRGMDPTGADWAGAPARWSARPVLAAFAVDAWGGCHTGSGRWTRV